MFKSARWRSDKNKIKAVFRLQFNATQVSWSGGDSLMISVIPGDVGKPTTKLEKVKVRDGSCSWEKPIYETMKFTREPKTGKINEKLFHFIIATGLSKFGVLGEVSIDFADYAEATKLSTMSLPVKNMKFEAVLHVSIERIQVSIDQREIDEGENMKDSSHNQSLRSHLSNSDMDGNIETNFAEVSELNGNCRTSSGSDVTMSSSDSRSGLSIPRELGLKNNNISKDRSNFCSSPVHALVPQRSIPDVSTTFYEEHQGTQMEWSGSSVPDVSTDDSSSSSHEALTREMSQHYTSETLVEKLEKEVAVLARQSEVTELELQTLRKTIVKESKKVQDLSRELVCTKEERDFFKEECEKLKGFQRHADEARARSKFQFEGGDPRSLLEELRQELNHEKDCNSNLRLQLQKTQESNSELILAVRDLDEMLEEKNREICNRSLTTDKEKDFQTTNLKCDSDVDEDQKTLEVLVKEHTDAKDAYVFEQKIRDLYNEIEIYRRDRDDLEMQMEQLALDYEILNQENHDISNKLEQSQLQEQLKMQYECTSYATLNKLETHIEKLENDLNKKSKEFSDSLITITDLENHVKSLEEELEKQAQGFEADLGKLTRSKVEQEQRAIRAEETLRKTRQQNANTAEKLQEEFRRLSEQMTSTFDANEMLAKRALSEANELRLEKRYLEEMLHKAEEELHSVRDVYEVKFLELSCEIRSKLNQIEQLQSEVEFKSTELENQRNHAEETHGVLSQEILLLRSEIEKLATEKNSFSEKLVEEKETLSAELEQMKKSIRVTELLVEDGNTERDELQKMIQLLKMEAEKSLKELDNMRSLKDKAESTVGNLQLELETIQTQYDEMKHSLSKDESENEKLRKQVIQLKGELKKKDDLLSSAEKKTKDSIGRAPVSDVAKARSNKYVPAPRGSKEVMNLKEKIRLLEGQIKLKEVALETSSNTLLEKEKDLQSKIEELEKSLEMLNQNAANFCSPEFQKVNGDNENLTFTDGKGEETMVIVEDSSTVNCTYDKTGCLLTLTESNKSDNELKDTATDSGDRECLSELLNEIALLKERNQLMECDLKDMQDRYSEISLKFAEVEGERQQLVMTLRNIKNSKKS